MGPNCETVRAFIGVGSNLGDPRTKVMQSVVAMGKLSRTHVAEVSSLYSSSPMGPAEQPDYINAVVALETGLRPRSLLEHLQRIEREQGRVRAEQRWGARALDLDILLYGSLCLAEPDLVIPHVGIAHRDFVLHPLKELMGGALIVPGLGTIDHLLADCQYHDLRRVGSIT